ncbi:hypothetical protein Y032_0033g2792 [Ancylostoma ceylanicum]|uniref:Uncharacterized protein n=1 Tax=Ancylostoma ceylanicum TaxID=53326 RepID=A0A016UMT0_9BILA|nr:hypothetical protein Y032_0033g2792 [Ancylostoma ceylanicum]
MNSSCDSVTEGNKRIAQASNNDGGMPMLSSALEYTDRARVLQIIRDTKSTIRLHKEMLLINNQLLIHPVALNQLLEDLGKIMTITQQYDTNQLEKKEYLKVSPFQRLWR